MNGLQEAIIKVIGLGDMQAETLTLQEAMDTLVADNQLLQRQIEDLDYLNLYDINKVTEVIPSKDRKATLQRLRRLRHDNPLAKQSIKLICRFTLGKGVQPVIAEDPKKVAQQMAANVAAKMTATTNLTRNLADNQPPPKNGTNGFHPPTPAKEAGGSSSSGAGIFGAAGPSFVDIVTDIEPTPVEPGEQADLIKEAFDAFWVDEDNQLTFTSPAAMKEWLDGVATDGERFFIGFTSEAAPYLKLTEVPLEEIDTIIYSQNNWKRPIYYRRSWQPMKYNGENGFYEPDGPPMTRYYLDYRITDDVLADATKGINIPKSKIADKGQYIYHSLINPLWMNSGRRGISELYASREWFRVFKEFMEDRAAINKAATAVAYKRKIKGGPTAVAQFQGKFGGLPVGVDNPDNTGNFVKKLTRPTAGATYDSNPAVDLEWMKTDTGAVNAKEDGRALLMSAGAGVSINSHYFGEGGDANLATAQAMELPMVKSFEDWQDFVGGVCLDLVYWVLRLATDPDTAKIEIRRCSFNFPPIISQDIVKWTTAWGQFVQQIAPDNEVVIEQAIRSLLTALHVPNIDAIMPQILAEQKQKQLEKQVRQQQMLDAVRQNPAGVPGQPPAAGAGAGPGAPRDGNNNVIDPQLKRIAQGRPPAAARNGPKPPR